MSELQRLRDRLDEAIEENRQLKSEIGIISIASNSEIATAIGVSPSQLKILALLARRKVATRSSIEMALWPDGEYPDTMRTVIGVHMSRLRKAVGRFGVVIESVRGEGWRIGANSRTVADVIAERLKA